MKTIAPAAAVLTLLALVACKGREQAGDTGNAAPAAATPPAAPSAMSNPDDVAHATYDPSLGVRPAEMTQLPNGVLYHDIQVGTGRAAGSGSAVAIYYLGRLNTGQTFDQAQPPGPPLQFTIDAGQVVPGFDWGVKGMKPGGKRLVVIPPSLGYGRNGNGPIPPNGIMVFTLDLVRSSGGR